MKGVKKYVRNAWTFEVLYSCKDDPVTCSHGPRNDRVAQIVVTPKHRVSLTHQRFPGAFAHGYGTISEINITCDVYKDGSRLKISRKRFKLRFQSIPENIDTAPSMP